MLPLIIQRGCMAKKKKDKEEKGVINESISNIDEYSQTLMDELNKEEGSKLFLNLEKDSAPTDVKWWASTSSDLLDWICSGIPNGGFPGGKIIEVSGPESIGKSHLAYQIAKSVQALGGIVCYIDTESATAKDNLVSLGVDFTKRFWFTQQDTIEAVFSAMEKFVKKTTKIPENIRKNVPLCVIWDSVGGIDSVMDSEKDLDMAQQPGVNAKQISRGISRVQNTIGFNDIMLVVINQQYTIIGAERWEKKTSTRGGKKLRYAADIRLELDPRYGGQAYVYPDEMEHKEASKKNIPPIGIRVKAKAIKNKITSPFRSCEFEIHFGVGIKDWKAKWEMLIENSPVELSDGRSVEFSNAAWKKIIVTNGDKIVLDDKFRKPDIQEKLKEHKKIVKECVDAIMSKRMKASSAKEASDLNPNSFEEVRAVRESVDELDSAFEELS